MISEPKSLLERRLVVVTGKGGVGKTAISCALAEAARRAGRRVLLAETAAAESIVSVFEPNARPLGYAGRELRPGLRAMHIDPHQALAEYVRLQIGLGPVTDRILKTETFQQLLEAAPGWRELIILGKIWHLEQQTDDQGRPLYDLLIVDAPATGHGVTFLDVPRVVQQAVRAGPLARHASWVEAMVHDRERTVLLPVTLPEELPIRETIELIDRARHELDIEVDRIVVNRLPGNEAGLALDALASVPADLEFEALPSVPELRVLIAHDARRAELSQARRIEVSNACALPVVDMPALPGGFDGDSDWSEEADRILAPARWPDRASDQPVDQAVDQPLDRAIDGTADHNTEAPSDDAPRGSVDDTPDASVA